jgi:hypothetical protein
MSTEDKIQDYTFYNIPLYSSAREGIELCKKLRKEANRRGFWLRQHGMQKFGKNDFSKENPHITLIIDEAANLFEETEANEEDPGKKPTKTGAQFKAEVEQLVRIGRALGISVVIALQRAEASVMSSGLRNNIGIRLVFCQKDLASVAMGLGNMGVDDLYAGMIPQTARGVGYSAIGDTVYPRLFKGSFQESKKLEADAKNLSCVIPDWLEWTGWVDPFWRALEESGPDGDDGDGGDEPAPRRPSRASKSSKASKASAPADSGRPMLTDEEYRQFMAFMEFQRQQGAQPAQQAAYQAPQAGQQQGAYQGGRQNPKPKVEGYGSSGAGEKLRRKKGRPKGSTVANGAKAPERRAR